MLGWRIADRGQSAKITMGKLNRHVEWVLTAIPSIDFSGSDKISPFVAFLYNELNLSTLASCILPGQPVLTSMNIAVPSTVPCRFME